MLWWGTETVIPQSTVFHAKVVVCSLASLLKIFLLTLLSSQQNPAKLLWLFLSGFLFVLFCEVAVVF